ncbi:hypothetical protein [Algoriphagus halophytocola]|uniref:Glycosyltransferase RgtA/B/C/D-like domain-containing protein n=1 Tax=Algoriphagus halophytocola TaxID=2991499 RepID=A0ABY6MJI1_9BACT|nr:hypothetical protein [Algoriphagus sp. TR-M5]UZD23945.1 hypothetical protein OM944_05490 [Algoriphagus sp. TR-M5]
MASKRGLDVSDEGLYLFLAHPFQDNQAGIFNYDLFFKAWYQLTGLHFGIVGLRILRIVLYGFATVSLTLFYLQIRRFKPDFLNAGLLCFLAILLGYAFLPASLSYNHLSVVITSFWLMALSYQSQSFFRYLILGILIGLLVYVKFPTAFILWVITLTYFIFLKRLNLIAFIGIILPIGILEVSLYLVFGENATSRLAGASEWLSTRGEYGSLLLLKYTGVGLFWSLLGVVTGWLAQSYFSKGSHRLLFLMTAIILLGYLTWIAEDWHHLFVLALAIFIGKTLAKKQDDGSNPANIFWIVLLFALPFFLHLGSNVYWLRMGVHYMVFWVLALILLDAKLESITNYIPISVFSVSTVIMIFNGLWWHPFGQAPLWTYTEPWEYLPSKFILLRKGQVDILQGFQKQIPDGQEEIPAAYLIGGVPYLLGKTQPKSPAIWNKSQLEYFFPEGIKQGVILYFPTDSLPRNFTAKTIQFGWFE